MSRQKEPCCDRFMFSFRSQERAFSWRLRRNDICGFNSRKFDTTFLAVVFAYARNPFSGKLKFSPHCPLDPELLRKDLTLERELERAEGFLSFKA